MISFANFIEFVYNILAYFILIVYGCFCFITSSSDEFSIEDILFLTDVILFLSLTMVLALTFLFFLIAFLLEHMYLEVFQLFVKTDLMSYQHFLRQV